MTKNLLIALLAVTSYSFAQTPQNHISENSRKGKLYFYWGWNGASYSKSNISFRGNDYSFTLKNVKAEHRQSKFSVDKYLNPGNMTIPQYNFRVGYYFTNNWDVSFGIDHMKYVVKQGSAAKISGTINNTDSNYNGGYYNDDITIQEGFLEFEHTDGLNFANFDIRHTNQIIDANKVKFNLTKGVGAGLLYPKTNAVLLNNERYDDFNVAGYGISAVAGVNIVFFKRFFIQSEIKGGYINLPNIRTTLSSADSASQSFFFFQRNILIGGIFNLSKASKIKK